MGGCLHFGDKTRDKMPRTQLVDREGGGGGGGGGGKFLLYKPYSYVRPQRV